MAYLLVGIEHDFAGGLFQIAGGHTHHEFSPPRFGQLSPVEALFYEVQFSFAHRAFEPQEQAIVVRSRIIYSVQISDQGAEQGADLQQLVPVL